MSPFENLPYRLTRGIVELIPRDKLNRFDTVAVVDLQNLRLVSTRVCPCYSCLDPLSRSMFANLGADNSLLVRRHCHPYSVQVVDMGS